MRDLLFGGFFNQAQHAGFFGGNEQYGPPFTAGAAGATDTVHIGFGVIRHIVIDNVCNALHIQPAGGHIRRHDDVQRTVFQLLNGLFARRLFHIAVQRRRCVTAGFQFFGQFHGFGFSAHKYQYRIEIFGFQDAGQGIEFMHAADLPITLFDGGHGGGGGFDFDLFRIAQVPLRDVANGFGHGGGEQCHLAVGGGLFQNPFHVFEKPHVEHFIGFIQHQGFNSVQWQGFAAQVIHDPPRSTNHDVSAAFQQLQLRTHILTTVNRYYVKTF